MKIRLYDFHKMNKYVGLKQNDTESNTLSSALLISEITEIILLDS